MTSRSDGVRDRERMARVCAALERGGYDLLVCARPTNVRMLTGYCPVVGTAVAACTRTGSIRLVVPDDEAPLARRGWADEVVTFSPGTLDSLTTVEAAVAPALTDLLRSLGLGATASICCEMGGVPEPASYASVYRYGVTLARLVGAALPDAHVADDEPMLARLRAVLTPRELDVLREACRVAVRAIDAGLRGVVAGMTETTVADRVRAGLNDVGPDVGRAHGFAFCMAGAHAASASAAFQRSRPTPIAAGDLVLVHCNSAVDGLWTDLTRTFVMSEMSARNRRMFDAVHDASAAAVAAIRPGATGRDVDAAARRVLERHGFGDAFRHGAGHGVGFAAADHNAQPRLHPASDDVLVDGMAFNLEPAVYVDGYGGVRRCDVVALVDGHADVLTAFDPDPVIEAEPVSAPGMS